MLFNSLPFLVFLVVVLGLYWCLSHRLQNRMLLAASYLFYGWWDERFLYLIIISTVVDYGAALMISKGTLDRRQRITASLYAVLSALVFVTIDWASLAALDSYGDLSAVLHALAPTRLGTVVFFLTLALCGVANVLMPRIAALAPTRRRKVSLAVSVIVNLGILAVFKYYNFFLVSAADLVGSLGLSVESLHLDVVLPVGISFYTFQTMSYTIGVYRGEVEASEGFLDFALFVAFFPQLVAGPIERASRFLPQVFKKRTVDVETITRGLYLILFGFFKKVAIADGLAKSVASVYNATGDVGGKDILMATFFFAIQIYCDFSGYSDIARGCAKLLGFDLMVNFNVPYVSKTPSEFWTRWHISLSSWLRDYLYIPLGGNRGGSLFVYRNLMLTMILGGLWHGAAWNFVLWGLYQGGILCVYRMLGGVLKVPAGRIASWVVGFLQWALFFVLTCYGWLLFRAVSLAQVRDFTLKLLSGDLGGGIISRPTLAAVAGIPLLILLDALQVRYGDAHFYRRIPALARGFAYAVILVIILMGLSNEPTQFIYFQF